MDLWGNVDEEVLTGLEVYKLPSDAHSAGPWSSLGVEDTHPPNPLAPPP